MYRVMSAAIFVFSSACAAGVTPAEIVKELDKHVAETYSDASCSFRMFDNGAGANRLHVDGTLILSGDDRRLDFREDTLDATTNKKFWMQYRYVRTAGKLYSNIGRNSLVMQVPDQELRDENMMFENISPWKPLALVGGEGHQSIKELLSDKMNDATVLRESESEVVVDVKRGPSPWLTFHLDPSNHYVVKYVEFRNGGKIYQERFITYKDGLVSGVKNVHMMDYSCEFDWKAGPTTKEISPQAIMSDGDIMIGEKEDGTKAGFRKSKGVVRFDPAIVTEPLDQLVARSNASSKPSPVVTLDPVDAPWLGTKSIFGIAAFAILCLVAAVMFRKIRA